jgi:hypothetical protein
MAPAVRGRVSWNAPSWEAHPMRQQLPNDPDDDGNALAGVFYAVLVVAMVGLVVLLLWWVVAVAT